MLLRNPSSLDADETIQPFVKSGHARLVKGDALKLEDVAHAWEEAQKASPSGHVDVVFFAIGACTLLSLLCFPSLNNDTGGVPDKFSLTKGVRLPISNLCTTSMINVLRTLPASQRAEGSQPKLIVISSTGITKRSHDKLPFFERAGYNWLIGHPLTDKFGMERILAYVSGREWTDPEYRSLEGVLPPDAEWQALEGLPPAGSFTNMLTVRPGWLTNGACTAEVKCPKGNSYIVVDDEEKANGYAVSRNDVAYFVAEEALDPLRWDEWRGRRVSLAY